MNQTPDTIARLVAALPELYQPVFGHAEFEGASRATDDRIAVIRQAADALSRPLGRRLRVLDLGCAQGYVSLSLAQDGHEVTGLDYGAENIALAQALALEHPGLKAAFSQGDVEPFIEQLPPGAFDLVLGLSLFHHIAQRRGVQEATRLIGIVAGHTTAAIFELALREEPLPWAAAQPEDPEALLAGYPFIHELARFPTHLSEHKRPLYFGSATRWYFGAECEAFEKWTDTPHAISERVHQGTRRYFFSESRLVKRFRLIEPLAAANLAEIEGERRILEEAKRIGGYPAVIEHGRNDREAWLVRELTPGRLLLDIIAEEQPYDADRVITDVLQELVTLKKRGLFHADVTVWNTLIKPDGSAILIDYGAIAPESENCAWPRDLLQAFVQFVHAVTTRQPARSSPIRRPYVSPANLPDKHRGWILAYLETGCDWDPQRLLATMREATPESGAHSTPLLAWQGAIEQHLDVLGDHARHVHARLENVASHLHHVEAQLREKVGGLAADASIVSDLRNMLASHDNRLDELRDEAKRSALRQDELSVMASRLATQAEVIQLREKEIGSLRKALAGTQQETEDLKVQAAQLMSALHDQDKVLTGRLQSLELRQDQEAMRWTRRLERRVLAFTSRIRRKA
jgi:SAM-dependent methyltransferase